MNVKVVLFSPLLTRLTHRGSLSFLGTSAAIGFLLIACGGKETSQATPAAPPPPAQRAAARADAGPPVPADLKPVDYAENDFVESDRDRDPFRSYATMFMDQGRKPAANQRNVILSQYAIDELKLVAIVTGVTDPRGMLVDPNGKGWVVRRGDYVGRPDVVHTGGANGADYQLNWRIDRVRDGDLVFTREDPAQPGVAPATRVVPLHPEPNQQSRL